MKTVSGAQISPDGRHVAYVVRQTNWEENEFTQQIWIAQTATGRELQGISVAALEMQPVLFEAGRRRPAIEHGSQRGHGGFAVLEEPLQFAVRAFLALEPGDHGLAQLEGLLRRELRGGLRGCSEHQQ